MSDQTCISNIPEEIWRAAIAALKAGGWTAQIGGGLDFSWALLTRDGMRIDMEYDIWCDGEMSFATADAPIIRSAVSSDVFALLEI